MKIFIYSNINKLMIYEMTWIYFLPKLRRSLRKDEKRKKFISPIHLRNHNKEMNGGNGPSSKTVTQTAVALIQKGLLAVSTIKLLMGVVHC